MERLGRLFSIGYIAQIKPEANAEAIFTIEDVAQSHLAQIIPALLVVSR